MIEYKIEKGIPIPPKSSRKGEDKYPFAEMEVGDSFLYVGKHTSVGRIIQCASKRLGFKFTTRKVEGGVRVWRVE